nr:helix-turn-helix transcriptional regulator [Burkholderia multivorans]
MATVRKQRGMTQAEVAQRIDVDAETVSRFERGTVTPGLMTLERVCAVLGCTWTDVLEGASTEPEQVGPDIARLLTPLTPDDRTFLFEQIKTWAKKLNERH